MRPPRVNAWYIYVTGQHAFAPFNGIPGLKSSHDVTKPCACALFVVVHHVSKHRDAATGKRSLNLHIRDEYTPPLL